MAYMDGKAAGRRTPGDSAGDKPAPSPGNGGSNQVKSQGQSAKFHTYGTNAGVSNQIRFNAGKGLGVAGRPSAIALDSKDKKFPAVTNPSNK